MTKYVYEFAKGDKDQKDLLGGKGANLAEMTNLDLSVPPDFTISTMALREGREPGGLRVQVTTALRHLEDGTARRWEHGGDPESVHFFHEVGLDFGSSSPFRVPVARPEDGRAAVMA